MELFYGLLLIAGILLAFILSVLTEASYHSFKAKIPPEVDQPPKLSFYNWLFTVIETLAKKLESLGICKKHLLIRLFSHGLRACRASELLVEDLHFGEVPVRIYLPRLPSAGKRRGVVLLHGGCGMFGSIRSHDRICQHIAQKSDSVVVSVGYRLSPEHRYPTQTLDCVAATIHFLKTAENYGVDPTRIIVCGDSAGGTFATSTCQELASRTDIPKIRAQLLIYPFLQGVNFNLPSHQKNASIGMLSLERMICSILMYLRKDCSLMEAVLAGSHVPESMNLKYRKWINPDLIPEGLKQDYEPPTPASCIPQLHEEMKEMFETRFSPLLAEDAVVCCLPDTCIITCEHDVLRDDGLLYKKRLEDNDVKVTWCHVEDGFHGVLCSLGYGIFSFPSASKIMDHILNFIQGC
ncbi:arylacetamide deacetylase-like 3 [Numida meleagris]|uniref:arylacetamide deacetylase-like 3 n=1 Tax=Numida meleagris TaxID=8996 RepID=UPI000B3DA0E8|nr:arylacetamide deacetylase-like 3 [Numida meleagris]